MTEAMEWVPFLRRVVGAVECRHAPVSHGGVKAVFPGAGPSWDNGSRQLRTRSAFSRQEGRADRGWQSTETDWVSRFADEVIAEAERRAPGKPVVVASGLSPSGPIHLGNLREVMTPHLVADEIRRRGHEVRHLISWDDYDRYRKVPGASPASTSPGPSTSASR